MTLTEVTLIEVKSRLASLEAEIAALKEQIEQVEISEAHKRGIEQIERGEGVPAIEAIKALGRKYGLETRLNYTTITSPEALEDIEEAFQWLLEQTPQHAPLWYNGLLDAMVSLEQNPERCPMQDPSVGSRCLLLGDKQHAYRIIFEIRGQQVWISQVHHAARKR